MRILQVCVFIAIWYATTCTPDNKTHAPYDCIHVLHTKRRLYCLQCIVLEEQSWLATLHVALSIKFIVYAILKITRKGTTVPLYEFAARQPKKNIN